jgi:hypothetical protein
MTLAQFQAAFKLADSRENLTDDYHEVFDGYGLPEFEPVTVTIRQVARLMRWQAGMLNGNWDSEELNTIREVGRKKFLIAG